DGGEPHWRPRPLHRGRPSDRADEVAEPPVPLDGFALPERAHHLDCFRETVQALGPRRIPNAVALPQLPGRVVVRSDAQPQIEPAIGEMVDGARAFGEPRRVVRRWIDGVRHGGTDAHPPRLRRERAEHRPPVTRPRPEPVAVYDTIVAERFGCRPVPLKGGDVRAPGLDPKRQHQESIGGASAGVNRERYQTSVIRTDQPMLSLFARPASLRISDSK